MKKLIFVLMIILSTLFLCSCDKGKKEYNLIINNQANQIIDNVNVKAGEEFILPPYECIESGYTFVAWQYDGCLFKAGSKIIVNKDYNFSPLIEKNKLIATTITQISNISKKYDGLTVVNPQFVTNSDGKVTISYYSNGEKLDKAPVEAGIYYIRIEIAETDVYEKLDYIKQFSISKNNLTCNINSYLHELDGKKHGAIIEVEENVEFTILYSLDGMNYQLNPITFDNQGEHQLFIKIDAGKNYEIVNKQILITLYIKDYGKDVEWLYL